MRNTKANYLISILLSITLVLTLSSCNNESNSMLLWFKSSDYSRNDNYLEVQRQKEEYKSLLKVSNEILDLKENSSVISSNLEHLGDIYLNLFIANCVVNFDNNGNPCLPDSDNLRNNRGKFGTYNCISLTRNNNVSNIGNQATGIKVTSYDCNKVQNALSGNIQTLPYIDKNLLKASNDKGEGENETRVFCVLKKGSSKGENIPILATNDRNIYGKSGTVEHLILPIGDSINGINPFKELYEHKMDVLTNVNSKTFVYSLPLDEFLNSVISDKGDLKNNATVPLTLYTLDSKDNRVMIFNSYFTTSKNMQLAIGDEEYRISSINRECSNAVKWNMDNCNEITSSNLSSFSFGSLPSRALFHGHTLKELYSTNSSHLVSGLFSIYNYHNTSQGISVKQDVTNGYSNFLETTTTPLVVTGDFMAERDHRGIDIRCKGMLHSPCDGYIVYNFKGNDMGYCLMIYDKLADMYYTFIHTKSWSPYVINYKDAQGNTVFNPIDNKAFGNGNTALSQAHLDSKYGLKIPVRAGQELVEASGSSAYSDGTIEQNRYPTHLHLYVSKTPDFIFNFTSPAFLLEKIFDLPVDDLDAYKTECQSIIS